MDNKTGLLEELRMSVVQVTFTKVGDGTERVMKCTLMKEHLPPHYVTEEKDFDVIRTFVDKYSVWDIEKQAWRSFKLDSIKSVEVVKQ